MHPTRGFLHSFFLLVLVALVAHNSLSSYRLVDAVPLSPRETQEANFPTLSSFSQSQPASIDRRKNRNRRNAAARSPPSLATPLAHSPPLDVQSNVAKDAYETERELEQDPSTASHRLQNPSADAILSTPFSESAVLPPTARFGSRSSTVRREQIEGGNFPKAKKNDLLGPSAFEETSRNTSIMGGNEAGTNNQDQRQRDRDLQSGRPLPVFVPPSMSSYYPNSLVSQSVAPEPPRQPQLQPFNRRVIQRRQKQMSNAARRESSSASGRDPPRNSSPRSMSARARRRMTY